MKIVLALLGFLIVCANGLTVPSSRTLTVDGSSVKVEISTTTSNSVKSVSNLQNVEHVNMTGKIKESEIYEHGHTAKEKHERSYIYIKNMKSRLLRTRDQMRHKSFFHEDFVHAKEISDGTDNNVRSFKVKSASNDESFYKANQNLTYMNASNQNKYSSANIRFPLKNTKMNLMEPQKLISNEKLQFPPNMYKQNAFLGQRVKDEGRHYKIPFQDLPRPTAVIPVLGYITEDPSANKILLTHKDERNDLSAKIEKYMANIIKGDHSFIDKNKFNCYNSDCSNMSRDYRLSMNNGVRFGGDCMCLTSSHLTKLLAHNWHAQNKPITASEKEYIRSVDAQNTEYIYEMLLKETKKLSKIVDGFE